MGRCAYSRCTSIAQSRRKEQIECNLSFIAHTHQFNSLFTCFRFVPFISLFSFFSLRFLHNAITDFYGSGHDEDETINIWMTSYALTLQMMFEDSVVTHKSGRTPEVGSLQLSLAKGPTGKYWTFEDPATIKQLKMFIPIFLLLVTVTIVCQCLQEMLYEKENKFKSSMMLAGEPKIVYWSTWFLICLEDCLPLFTVLTALGIFFFFTQSSPFIVLIFFVLNMFAFASLVLFISSFLHSTGSGALMGTLVVSAMAVPGFFLESDSIALELKALILLLPPCTFSSGLHKLINAEVNVNPSPESAGVAFSDIATQRNGDETDVTFLLMYVMLIIATFLYVLLAWYFEQVIKTPGGKFLPYNFFLYRNYWYPLDISSSLNLTREEETTTVDDGDDDEDDGNANNDIPQSPVISGAEGINPVGIAVEGLRKVYGEDPENEKTNPNAHFYLIGDRCVQLAAAFILQTN
jgi:hypothetical protein